MTYKSKIENVVVYQPYTKNQAIKDLKRHNKRYELRHEKEGYSHKGTLFELCSKWNLYPQAVIRLIGSRGLTVQGWKILNELV